MPQAKTIKKKSTTKSNLKNSPIKTSKFNLKLALPLVLVIAIAGGISVYRSFASSPGPTYCPSNVHERSCRINRQYIVQMYESYPKETINYISAVDGRDSELLARSGPLVDPRSGSHSSWQPDIDSLHNEVSKINNSGNRGVRVSSASTWMQKQIDQNRWMIMNPECPIIKLQLQPGQNRQVVPSKKGDYGACVIAIQKGLRSLGYSLPINELSLENKKSKSKSTNDNWGIFGENTEQAVIQFNMANSIVDANGQPNPIATRKTINLIEQSSYQDTRNQQQEDQVKN